MNVKIANQKVTLDQSAVLGSGGEATVFDLNSNTVAKIFHNPNPAKTGKLLAALKKNWPDFVVAPHEIVFDAKGKSVLGYTMPRVPGTFEPLATLFRKSSRISGHLSTTQIVHLLLSLLETLQKLHSTGVVVGDLNDQNELWHQPTQIRLIDSDSFQFDGFGCDVATENYLAPELFGVDLSVGPRFLPQHDVFSFAVLAFRSLLCVHPFGGTHPTLNTISQRAHQGLWVFDTSVKYPAKVAMPPEILSTDLMDYFRAVFVAKQRPALPASLLQDYVATLARCNACGLELPKATAQCPSCSTQIPKPAVRTVRSGCIGELLLSFEGTLLTVGLTTNPTDSIIAVTVERGVVYAHRLAQGGVGSPKYSLGTFVVGDDFRVMRSGLIVRVRADQVDLLEIPSGNVVLSTSTESFSGHAVIATSGDELLRIAGGSLMRGQVKHGYLIERPVASTLDKQTWISPHGDDRIILGAHRVFRHVLPFKISNQQFIELPIPKLTDDESLLDLTLTTDGTCVLAQRLSSEKGILFTRHDLFDTKGSLACSSKLRSDSHPTRTSIVGRVFRGDVILHPTDDGIVHESVRFGSLGDMKILNDTEPFVSSQTILVRHPQGLIAANPHNIYLLQPRLPVVRRLFLRSIKVQPRKVLSCPKTQLLATTTPTALALSLPPTLRPLPTLGKNHDSHQRIEIVGELHLY